MKNGLRKKIGLTIMGNKRTSENTWNASRKNTLEEFYKWEDTVGSLEMRQWIDTELENLKK